MKSMKRYSPSEFGRLIGVSYQTLCRWEKQKKLIPHYTDTRRRYYTEQHLEQYMETRSQRNPETDSAVLFRKII